MALATQCPHCNTVFRVAHDQLKLRGGIVRCGTCKEVFDGNAALINTDALRPPEPGRPTSAPAAPRTTPAPPSTAHAATPGGAIDAGTPTPAAPDQPISHPEAEAEVYTLDFTTAFDPFGILPKGEDAHAAPGAAAAVVAPEPASASAPVAAHANPAVREVLAAPPAPVLAPEPEPEPEPMSEPMSEPEAEAGPEPEPARASAPEPVPATTSATPTSSVDAPPALPIPSDLDLDLDLDLDVSNDDEQPAHTPMPAARIEPVFDLVVDDELAAAPLFVRFAPPVTSVAPEPVSETRADLDAPTPAPASTAAPDAPSEPAMPAAADLPQDVHTAPPDPVEQAPVVRSNWMRRPARQPSMKPAPDAPMEADDDVIVALSAAVAAPAATQFDAPAAPAAEPDEPGFVKRERRQQRIGKISRIVMALGSLLLLGALLAQGVTTFRNVLAARLPQLTPALVSACAVLGCRIELPTQIDMLSVETGELQTLGGGNFAYATLLRNQSGLAQAWPHIELVLSDANDKAQLRRVFAPRDYLPVAVDREHGFGPHSEQPVRFYFALNQVKASGYHIAIFYP